MTLRRAAELLDAEVLLGDERLDREVRSCFAADLMSDVLRFADAGALLLTGLASIHSIHTADVAELAGVVFVENRRPGDDVVASARSRGIPLLLTGHPLEAARRLLLAAWPPAGP